MNVMLEYDLDEAQSSFEKNSFTATKDLDCLEEDLDFRQDPLTATQSMWSWFIMGT